jgi:hypothetical protein
MMPGAAIVLLYAYGGRFAGYMPLFWQYLGKSIQAISIESAI